MPILQLISTDPDGDFDMDEEYARTESSITNSATLSNQKDVNEDERFEVISTVRWDTQGMSSTYPGQ